MNDEQFFTLLSKLKKSSELLDNLCCCCCKGNDSYADNNVEFVKDNVDDGASVLVSESKPNTRDGDEDDVGAVGLRINSNSFPLLGEPTEDLKSSSAKRSREKI